MLNGMSKRDSSAGSKSDGKGANKKGGERV